MRKQPQQQRSRDMVESIVAAGAELLRRDGYEAFSTNQVARRAGISPGSLYQYFPNKGAIVAEVIDRWSVEVADRVTAALAQRVGEQGPGMIRSVVGALVEALEADAALLRIVLVELPPARTRGTLMALEQRVRELMTAYLAGRSTTAGTEEHATRAWVLVLAVENLIARWVLDDTGIARDRLVDEVAELCAGYLNAHPLPATSRDNAAPRLPPR